jgi:hypothetical protein
MSCTTIVGITRGACERNVGGLYEAHFIDMEDIVKGSIAYNETTYKITAMDLEGGASFESFYFKRNVSTYTASPATDLVNGTTIYTTTLTLAFHRREASKSRALEILGQGQRYLGIIFLDANGKYWFIDHAQLNGGDETSGTAKADGSKYEVSFTSDMDFRAYEVDADLAATLLGAGE